MSTKGPEKRLSSTVLEMKFMQRTKRKLEAREKKRKEIEARRQLLEESEDTTSSDDSKPCEYQFCTDLTFLEGLKFGRMSFKGFNPEVEKLMIYYERKMEGYESDSESDDGKDVGDLEMTAALRGGAASTIARKFYAPKSISRTCRSSDSLNEASTSERLNFSDVRKRTANGVWKDHIDVPPKRTRINS